MNSVLVFACVYLVLKFMHVCMLLCIHCFFIPRVIVEPVNGGCQMLTVFCNMK